MLLQNKIAAGVVAKVPLRRWGEPREIAGLALYLAGDAASYVTGAALTIDGGWSVH
ncbi:MAG: SDR family oxidoreductase [Gammaproteobacteria bacterium]|nr:SDR family oxidoreductase [Gammaproteobacteria bacterium]